MHDTDPLSRAAAERLRALPHETVEPYGWQEFQRRAARMTSGAAHRLSATSLALRAAAAMLLVAGATALAAWMWGGSAMGGGGTARTLHLATETARRSPARVAGAEEPGQLSASGRSPAGESPTGESSAGESPSGESPSPESRSSQIEGRTDAIDARARALERWLARQPAEPAMVRVGAYATEATLEDRIAQLDDLLTTARAAGVQSASLSPLEEQRSRLVSSLAQVRFAEALVMDSPR